MQARGQENSRKSNPSQKKRLWSGQQDYLKVAMEKKAGCDSLTTREKRTGKAVGQGCILLFVLLLTAGSSYSLNLTLVNHLFDIEHDFRQASDVAVTADGSIYVVDGVNQCVKVFDSTGKFLFSFGREGSGPGRFKYPLGMDIDGAGNLYVADSGNRRIQIFTAKGDFIREIGLERRNGKKPDPTDVAVNRKGTEAFVVDNENHCIVKYDLQTLQQVGVFGEPGIERMEFRYPFLIAGFRDKYLYVVDVINTRVQELTNEGKFVRFIGDWEVEKGQFFRPKGVAVDSGGRVYVSDSYMGVIQVFDEGVFHSVIGGSKEDGLWRFTSPVGIFIDQKDRLYVVEMFAERVSVFQVIR